MEKGSFSLQVGDLYNPNKGDIRKEIPSELVLDVDGPDINGVPTFTSVMVKFEEGTLHWNICCVSTAPIDHVKEIIGHFPANEVIEAGKRGTLILGCDLPQEYIEELRANFKKPPRTFKLP